MLFVKMVPTIIISLFAIKSLSTILSDKYKRIIKIVLYSTFSLLFLVDIIITIIILI